MTRDTDAATGPLARARECLRAGIDAAHPATVVENELSLDGTMLTVGGGSVDLAAVENVSVLGGGNAGGAVASALESVLGDRIGRGVVVTDDPRETDRIDVVEGTHPLPSEANVDGARRVLDAARDAGANDLVLAVIGGGGSALLCAPAGDVALDDLREVTEALLKSGAEIGEINAVRKHCSAIKGGRLARVAAPATVVGLAFSDVVGNRLDVIASGPTAPDETTYDDALAVLDAYDADAPASVRDHLAAGAAGESPETPGPDDPAFDSVSNQILADADTALAAAADRAAAHGYDPLVLSSRIRGEAREAARSQVAIAEEVRATGRPVEPPAAVLTGGETTVTVRGDGSGGPNLEFALSAALELDDAGVAVGSVDTDGIDGGTDVAGAVVDAATVTPSTMSDARDALADSDAGGWFVDRDEVVDTGPTGTNVNDLRIVLVDADGADE